MVKKIKILNILIIASILLNGCSSVMLNHSPKENHITGNNDINNLINQMDSISQLGILVEDMDSGKKLIDFRSNRLFTPASNVKLFTATTALGVLGENFHYTTEVLAKHNKQTGFARWLCLKGDGDPFLSLAALDSIADLVSRYIKDIDTLIIDGSIFDNFNYGPGWMWDDGSDRVSAPVAGLNLNWNTVDIIIPSVPGGELPSVNVSPETDYVVIHNNVTIVADTLYQIKLKAERRWWNNSNLIDVDGSITYENLPDTLHSNIYDPVKFTGTVFKEMLLRKGISVKTMIFTDLPDNGEKLLSHNSESLPGMISHFLKETDNLVGEALLKTIGINETTHQGSWSNGLKVQRLFLSKNFALDTLDFKLADGSGMSRYNLLSPNIIVKLLKFIYQDPSYKNIIIPSLPISGVDGTLKDRMLNTVATGRITAKTGTLGGISALSGYGTTLEGRKIVFSLLMNGYTMDKDSIRKFQDNFCELLVREDL